MDLDVLKVKFTHSNTVRDKKPYTIYEIEVRSSSTITWVIYKRYSSFFVLHQALVSSLMNIPGGKNVKLPPLPPKRLTRSLASEFVEKRKNELEDYLRSVLASTIVLQCEAMLSFLEVPDSVRPMLSRGTSKALDYRSADGDINDGMGDKLSYGAKTADERKVLELVQGLKSHPNKVAALQSFEHHFFSQRPRLSAEAIRMLFEGVPGDSTGGLIYTCGDFRHSRVASRAALWLLDRLLDAEKNKDASTFIEQMCALPASVLQKMKLHVHILSSRGNRGHAFQVVRVICQHLESSRASLGSSLPGELSLETIVHDPTARQDYLRWVACRDAHHVVAVYQEDEFAAEKLASRDGNHKALVSSGFIDVLELAEREEGWKDVNPAIFMGTGAESASTGVHLSYHKDADRDFTCMRASVLVNASADDITAVLTDVAEFPTWDTKVRAATVVHQVDEATDIVHIVYRTMASYYKSSDFALLRSISRLDDGGVLLMFRSIISTHCPETRECTRAHMRCSGYIITPISSPSPPSLASDFASGEPAFADDSEPCCMITYLLQLDRDSVILVSQDLLGESHDVITSMLNLSSILQGGQAGTVADEEHL